MAAVEVLATLGLAMVNAALAAMLVALYGKAYTKVRAPFTVGLVIFAACFLAQNLLLVYGYLSMMEIIRPESWYVPYFLGIMVFQAVGLAVMVHSAAK